MNTNSGNEVKEVKAGPGALSIIGFIAAFLAAPVGFILSIIALVRKDGKRKGFAVAGLIISVILTIIGVISAIVVFFGIIGAGVMAPQVVKYASESNLAQDLQLCSEIQSAMTVAALDPDVVGDLPESSSIPANLEDLPEGKYRDAIEEILGCSLEDLKYRVKSIEPEDTVILYKYNGNKIGVRITNLDPTGTNSFHVEINF